MTFVFYDNSLSLD